ncbi:nucleoside diphosphate kinase regulator [Methylophaga sp.]|jgi:regulator of nucleoside diphosphate kinase|uniref:nucleoside diphosphate kinase regulator n=1 Tax=Methylophaga sp. TaxID=2024840 RepID=UPI0013FEC771|nr:nucleoside diphosphate kinase regulator [Methylophaga sp.]MTI63309.1 nucleoside diphosphate kinase regulator [Methylophaga sp.]
MKALQPEIVISELDLKRIEQLLSMQSSSELEKLATLEDELERANVVEPAAIPGNVVTMNSTVKFSVSSSQQTFCLTLVYPKDMTDDGKTISILAPAGSAMLGLLEGDEIEWPTPDGKAMKVKVEEILYQPERAGEFHR